MKKMLKNWILMLPIVALVASAFAEDPNQWMYGYYGLESDPNTVALWHLDDSLVDNTGNGHDFTRIDNGAAFTTSGKFNQGVDFPGSGENLLRRTVDGWTGDPNGYFGLLTADGATIEAWIYPDVSPQKPYAGLMWCAENDGLILRYDINGTRLRADVLVANVGGIVVEGTTDITAGQWHHVALVRDKATGSCAIYLDGSLEASMVSGMGENLYGASPGTIHVLEVGRNLSTFGREFDGKIDEIRISRVARFEPPLPVCGDPGTVMEADISGPDGVPDCYVNMYDFAALAAAWLNCTEPTDPNCQ